MSNTVKKERHASKNEEKKVKKEIAELWAWQLSEKCQMGKGPFGGSCCISDVPINSYGYYLLPHFPEQRMTKFVIF